jgi:hypothetical protein
VLTLISSAHVIFPSGTIEDISTVEDLGLELLVREIHGGMTRSIV